MALFLLRAIALAYIEGAIIAEGCRGEGAIFAEGDSREGDSFREGGWHCSGRRTPMYL